MNQSNCLNCDTPLTGKFCHECGQKADTHRITPQHFVVHDLLHGVMHVDKGILFTLKETFVRPGLAAKDYIAGRRKKYYNIFYLMFVLTGLVLIAKEQTQIAPDLMAKIGEMPKLIGRFIIFVYTYNKQLPLLFLPLASFAGFVLFERLRFNYFEHFFIAGYAFLGSVMLALLGAILGKFLYYVEGLLWVMSILFVTRVYFQATKGAYTRFGFTWRILCFWVLLLILAFMCLAIITSYLLYS